MSAAETLHLGAEPEVTLWCLFFLVFEICPSALATGTTDIDLTLLFSVEVDQDVTGEELLPKRVSTCQAGLFIDREKSFNLAVSNVVGSQKCQLCGNTNAVVGSQCGAVSLDPVTVDDGFDGIVVEIVLHP